MRTACPSRSGRECCGWSRTCSRPVTARGGGLPPQPRGNRARPQGQLERAEADGSAAARRSAAEGSDGDALRGGAGMMTVLTKRAEALVRQRQAAKLREIAERLRTLVGEGAVEVEEARVL